MNELLSILNHPVCDKKCRWKVKPPGRGKQITKIEKQSNSCFILCKKCNKRFLSCAWHKVCEFCCTEVDYPEDFKDIHFNCQPYYVPREKEWWEKELETESEYESDSEYEFENEV